MEQNKLDQIFNQFKQAIEQYIKEEISAVVEKAQESPQPQAIPNEDQMRAKIRQELQQEFNLKLEEAKAQILKERAQELSPQGVEARREEKQEHLNKVLELARQRGAVKTEDVRLELRVSERTAQNYLDELVGAGRLVKEGSGPETSYRLP